MNVAGATEKIEVVAGTRSASETRQLGAAFAAEVLPGDVILLVGDLGAGKTAFVQGFGVGLGVDEPVTSPTFTLARTYQCGPAGVARGIATLLHADVYRLEKLQDVLDLDLHELSEEAAVVVVEWGDLAAPVLGQGALEVHLGPGPGDDDRTVTLVAAGPWASRAQGLATRLAPWSTAGSA